MTLATSVVELFCRVVDDSREQLVTEEENSQEHRSYSYAEGASK